MNLMGQGVAQQIKVHVAKLNGLSLIPQDPHTGRKPTPEPWSLVLTCLWHSHTHKIKDRIS